MGHKWQSNNAENGQNVAAAVEGLTSVNAVTNVVQNYIPRDWLAKTLPDPFKYASVVKQIFIMNADVTVKMQRTMDAAQRNLETLMQYTAWVENLEMCYEDDVISKFLQYTTKTMRKEYSGHDVFRKFCDGLQVFQNTFTPIWNAVLAVGISGKTWPEVGMMDDLRGQIDDQRRPCECRKPVKCRVQDGLTVGVQVPRRYREIFGAACTRGIQVGERVHTTV